MPKGCKAEIAKRRTFAIISHPDAGKTTMTEKLLLLGGAIQLAGTVKGRKSGKFATSDWMAMEKERGISVTTSVMQFPYQQCIFNLLDTPGHEDFSEDTYRTLTAVDSALMVIDAVKGVEARTIKLMEICRLRSTPIITFINKLDRDSREPLDLLDEIEAVLKMDCVPVTWPIGCGKNFKGVYEFAAGCVHLCENALKFAIDDPKLAEFLDQDFIANLQEEVSLMQGAGVAFDQAEYLAGRQTPVCFGSALNNFGIESLLELFANIAPPPGMRASATREVLPAEDKFSGFVFKIQANMDAQHRDRIAFLRICSGKYTKGMKLTHLRLKRTMQISNAVTFMAGARDHVEQAWPGDIIGLHNHGTIKIGDTFTEGESLKFIGIPNFAPELFKAVRPADPLKAKALQKGLLELSEEGATQVFRPLNSNSIILGAVGVLQFDVVAHRLKFEYNVACQYDAINIATIRWVQAKDNNEQALAAFRQKYSDNLALDSADYLAYLAPTVVNLNLTMERCPEITFSATREH